MRRSVFRTAELWKSALTMIKNLFETSYGPDSEADYFQNLIGSSFAELQRQSPVKFS